MSDVVPVKEYAPGLTGDSMCDCVICGKEFMGLREDDICPRTACAMVADLKLAIMLHSVNCKNPTENDKELWGVINHGHQ